MTELAIDGSFALVLGSGLRCRRVAKRVSAGARARELEVETAQATGLGRSRPNAELADLRQSVRAEKISEIAAEFDSVHSIRQAVEVGSIDAVIQADELRARIIGAIEKSPACGKRNSKVVSS